MSEKGKRILLAVAGWGFFLLGIAGLFLPLIPGLLFIPIGIYLLYREYTWFSGNKEETVEEPVEKRAAKERLEEEEVGFPPELPEERGFSWWRPWTWFRRGAEEFEELGVSLPPEEKERVPGEGVGVYPPQPTLRPSVEEFPKLERERPPKEVLVEEEELEVFPPEEEVYPGGLYISGRKIQGGFKKFCLALFSIFLLPFILVFGVCLATCAFLLVFPMIMAFFPIFLIGLFMLFIIVPVAVPVLIVYVLATERSILLINSKGHLFSVQGLSNQQKSARGE